MGIRNKVVKDGFIETGVDGDTGLFGFEQQLVIRNGGSAALSSPQAITTGLTVLSGSLVTASLPTISTTVHADGTIANGLVCTVLLGSADTFLLSASVPINGNSWTKNTVGASSSYKILTCVGVTGQDVAAPIQWFVTSGSVV